MSPSGRSNSEFARLERSLKELDQKIEAEITAQSPAPYSVLFLAEALAWSIVRLAQAVVFAQRLGSPGADSDVFGVLQKNEILDLVSARKLKQFCELRHLSSRESYQINEPEVFEILKNRAEILALAKPFFQALNDKPN